jgi:hypothetical protein
MDHLEFSEKLNQHLGDKAGLAQFAVDEIAIDGDDVFIPPDFYDKLFEKVITEIVIQGKIKVLQDYNEYRDYSPFKSGRDYESEVLENPSWADLISIANEIIETTKDTAHIKVKGIEVLQKLDDIKLCKLNLELAT